MTTPGNWAGPPLVPGDWRDLPLSEALPLLLRFALLSDDTRAKMLFIEHSPTRVRTLRARFYPGWELVEVQAVLADGAIGLCNFLHGPGGHVLLDGASAPIHDLNEKGALAIREDDAAADYLRFFCSAVHGDEGRFRIVEHGDDLRGLTGAEEALQAVDAAGARQVGPVTLTRQDNEFRATGMVLYGTSLFEATFQLNLDGTIEMVDDLPVGSVGAGGESFRWPFRIP